MTAEGASELIQCDICNLQVIHTSCANSALTGHAHHNITHIFETIFYDENSPVFICANCFGHEDENEAEAELDDVFGIISD